MRTKLQSLSCDRAICGRTGACKKPFETGQTCTLSLLVCVRGACELREVTKLGVRSACDQKIGRNSPFAKLRVEIYS